MKDRKKIIDALKSGTGKFIMAVSLFGMVSMPVNATELNEIKSSVTVGQYQVNLNANGRIEYDKNEDGNKEVFYDFMDYQKLGQSLSTIDKNETELKNEYTRLYNLAESNRQRLIADWNAKFYPNQQIPANGKYIQGGGTASIDGAINSMPRHRFSEIVVGVDANGNVGATYPNPAWGYYNDDDGRGINLDAVREALKHTGSYTFGREERSHDFGEIHNIRVVDAGPAIDESYEKGLVEGRRSATVSNNIATSNWFNNKTVDATLIANQTYNIFMVNSGINSEGTNLRLKIKGAKKWNIINVTKTVAANGSDGSGGHGTYTALPSGNNLHKKIKSLGYAANTDGTVQITIVPKEHITVTLAVAAYNGYGIAFME